MFGEPGPRATSQKSAMEGHAALPPREPRRDARGSADRGQQHVADAAAGDEDDAERHPQDEIVVIGVRERCRPPSLLIAPGTRAQASEQDAADRKWRNQRTAKGAHQNHCIELGKGMQDNAAHRFALSFRHRCLHPDVPELAHRHRTSCPDLAHKRCDYQSPWCQHHRRPPWRNHPGGFMTNSRADERCDWCRRRNARRVRRPARPRRPSASCAT